MFNENYIKKLISSRTKKSGLKLDQSQIDYNNYLNILCRIDHKIEIKDAHPHPLIYCFHFLWENEEKNYWNCKKCNQNYHVNIPAFLCTACHYNLCQKCFLRYKVKDITLLSLDKKENICDQNHELILIQINNIYKDCSNCGAMIEKYCKCCSLCNYFLCPNCVKNK